MGVFNLAELERLARAATPGPWEWWTSNSFRRLSARRDGDVLCAVSCRDGVPDIKGSEANKDFIAGANPETVLALIERLKEARTILQD